MHTVTDIDEAIVQYAKDLPSGVTLRDEAIKLASRLSEDPQWVDWVDATIVELVHERIRSVLRSERARSHHASRRDAWNVALDVDGTAPLETSYYIAIDGSWKHIGDMSRGEVLAEADRRHRQAQTLLFTEAFLRAIAKRVPEGKVVRDVFDNDQLQRLWQSISE